MDQEHGDFKVLDEWGVLLCCYCGYCVNPSQLEGHMRLNHQGITKEKKNELIQWVKEVKGLKWVLNELRYPSKQSEGVKELEIQRGMGCRWLNDQGEECCFVCSDEGWMKTHLRDEHGWKNERGRGSHQGVRRGVLKESLKNEEGVLNGVLVYEEERDDDGVVMKKKSLYEEGVLYQVFFVRGSWRKAFEVKRKDRRVLSQEDLEIERIQMVELEKKLIESMETKVEQLNKEIRDGKFDDQLEREEVNSWLKFTKWNEYVRGVEMRDVRRWLRGWSVEENERWERLKRRGDDEDDGVVDDEEDEKALRRCCELNEEVMFDVMVLVGSERCGENVLRYVCRRETGDHESTKKFRGNWKVETLRRYADNWRKVLCFVWRTRDVERGEMSCEMSGEERMMFDMMKDGVEELMLKGGLERREKVKKMIVDLWLMMLDSSLDGDGRKSVFVCGIVLLGVDCWSGRWRDGGDCGRMLNTFVGLSRGMVVWRCWEEKMEEELWMMSQGTPKERVDWEVRGLMERVVERTDRLLMRLESGVRDDRSVRSMGMILNWRSYGMVMGMNRRVGSKMEWKGDEILIGNVRLSVDKVKSWIWGLMKDCWKMLMEELLFVGEDDEEEMRRVGLMFDLTELIDMLGEEDDEYSFVSDERNVKEVFKGMSGLEWMRSRISRTEGLKRRFWEVRDGELRWKRKGLNEYVRKVKVWKELMLLLCHLSGGGPGRGREVLSVRRKNGKMGVVRGVYVDNGLVCLVSRYHKGYSVGMREKMVVRYLCEKASRMMVLYLWIVCGFVDVLMVSEFEKKSMGEFVWQPMKEKRLLGAQEWKGADVEEEGGEDEDEEELDEEDEGFEEGEDDQEVGVGLDSVGEVIEDDEEKMRVLGERMKVWRGRRDFKAKEIEERLKLSGGWRGKEECLEVDGFWSGKRLSRVMMRDGRRRGLGGIGLKSWRDVYVGIQRRLCGERVRNHMEMMYGDGGGEKQLVGSLMENITSLQLGHGRRVENMVYGLSSGDSRLLSGEERLMFREVSVEWHRIMGIEGEIGGRRWGFGDEEMRRMEEKVQRARMLRLKEVKEVNEEKWNMVFRVLLKREDVCLRKRQLEVLKEVVSGRWMDLLVIMRTGGGKSLLWMLPTFVGRKGLTVVVIPLISLIDDMKRRLEEMGISCWRWNGDEEVEFEVSVVLVTAEGVNTMGFAKFLNEMDRLGRLDRIVVDECHELMSVLKGWRMSQLVVKRLRERGVGMLYLTATLPMGKLDEWCEVVGVRKKGLKVMRESSVRKNIRYGVVEYVRGEKDEELKQLVVLKRQEYGLGKKVMVFCDTKVRVKEVMELLRCKGYWSDVGTEREKRMIMEEFLEGESDVIVGTNAMGLGIDSDKVRVVIHERMRRDLMSFGQESGRGGRVAGMRSESVVMRECYMVGRRLMKQMVVKGEDEREYELLKRYLDGEECRRKSLEEWFDGVVREGGCKVDEGEEECDVCRGEVVGFEFVDEGVVDEMVGETVGETVGEGGGDGGGGGGRVRKHVREESGVGLREMEEKRKMEVLRVEREREEEMREWKVKIEMRREEERVRMEKVWRVGAGGGRGLRERRRVERFGKVMDRWLYGMGRCWVCGWRGGSGWEHEWKDCEMVVEGRRVIDVLKGGIERFGAIGGCYGRKDLMEGRRKNSGCWGCGVMRELCGGWKRAENGMMRKVKGSMGGCSFEGEEVMGLLVYLLEVGVDEGCRNRMRGFVEGRMRDEGVVVVREGNEDGWMNEEVMGWLWRRRMWCISGVGVEVGIDEEDDDDERFVGDWKEKVVVDMGWKGWRGGIETNNVCEVIWMSRKCWTGF